MMSKAAHHQLAYRSPDRPVTGGVWVDEMVKQAAEEATAAGTETVGGRPCLKVMGIERWRYPSGQVTGVRPITIWIDAMIGTASKPPTMPAVIRPAVMASTTATGCNRTDRPSKNGCST